MENTISKYLQADETDATAAEEAGTEDREDMAIPEKILAIDSLDPKKGLEYCGEADDYLYALKTYAESSDEKYRQIKESLDNDDLDNYTLIIHSLKSMSKSIGAVSLCEEARELEMSGREGKKDILKKDTPVFLEHYKTLCDQLREGIPADLEI